jgi:ribokinase
MAGRPERVVVVGSVNTDLVVRVRRLPRPGETLLGGEYYEAAGGKGANQAVAAARAAQTPVTFVAAVGDDAYGRQALSGLARENLDTRWIKVVPAAHSGVALIMVAEGGENSIAVASGANLALSPADIDALPDDLFANAGVLLTCLESPLATVEQALRRAKNAGLLTVLNPAPAGELVERLDLLSLADVLTPNEGEAALLTGLDCGGAAGWDAAIERLRQLGCPRCVITLGGRGCVVLDDGLSGEGTVEIAGQRVKAIDATAAGDAFNGALAVALAEGRTLVEAAQWANRAAAISVTRRGAQPSLPNRDEIDRTPRS